MMNFYFDFHGRHRRRLAGSPRRPTTVCSANIKCIAGVSSAARLNLTKPGGGFNLYSLLVSILGAVILLAIVKAVRK